DAGEATDTAPTPATPQPKPTTQPATPTADTQPPQPKPEPKQDKDLHGAYKGIFSKVYSTGTQKAQVWASEGGVSSTPNIYVHFHGHRTNYGIDPDLKWDATANAPKEDEKKVDK